MGWIAAQATGSAHSHVLWIVGAAAAGFLASFAGAGEARLPREWFVLAHGAVSGGLFAVYATNTGFRLSELRARPLAGIALAVLAGAFSVHYALSQPASSGPEGIARMLAVLWLGAVYGLVDALLLTVLPVRSVWCMARCRGWLGGWPGRIATGVLALAASLLVTLAYHLGFPEFRGADVIQPVIGNAVFAAAYILSGSPLAPLLAHVALHIAALTHAYGTSIPLPPHY